MATTSPIAVSDTRSPRRRVVPGSAGLPEIGSSGRSVPVRPEAVWPSHLGGGSWSGAVQLVAAPAGEARAGSRSVPALPAGGVPPAGTSAGSGIRAPPTFGSTRSIVGGMAAPAGLGCCPQGRLRRATARQDRPRSAGGTDRGRDRGNAAVSALGGQPTRRAPTNGMVLIWDTLTTVRGLGA